MSLPDTVFIFALALVIFGPKKLPEIGRQIGKLVYEFRRASNEFKLQIEEELRSAEEADRQKQYSAQSASLPAASVVSTEMTSDAETPSDSSEGLTVHPPSTGVQVNANNPSHTYAGEPEEKWDSWSGDTDATPEEAQYTEEGASEEALQEAPEESQAPVEPTVPEPEMEPAIEEARGQASTEPTVEFSPEAGLEPEPVFERSEGAVQEEFQEPSFDLIDEQPHTRALAHSIAEPAGQAQEQATNHHG